MNLTDIIDLLPQQQIAFAEHLQISRIYDLSERELVFAIAQTLRAMNGEIIMANGKLDIRPSGFGFLRHESFDFQLGPYDIYVSATQIQKFNLQNGDMLYGDIRPPKIKEQYFALLRISRINDQDICLLSDTTSADV